MSKIKYSEIINSDFFRFFNLHEVKSDKTSSKFETKCFKPGGFQDNIDIEFKIKNDEITSACLFLDRLWIGNDENINPFGTDIVKSFIEAMTPTIDKEKIIELVHFLFNLKGKKDIIIPCQKFILKFQESNLTIKKILNVYKGLDKSYELVLSHSKFVFTNIFYKEREFLIIKFIHI